MAHLFPFFFQKGKNGPNRSRFPVLAVEPPVFRFFFSFEVRPEQFSSRFTVEMVRSAGPVWFSKEWVEQKCEKNLAHCISVFFFVNKPSWLTSVMGEQAKEHNRSCELGHSHFKIDKHPNILLQEKG